MARDKRVVSAVKVEKKKKDVTKKIKHSQKFLLKQAIIKNNKNNKNTVFNSKIISDLMRVFVHASFDDMPREMKRYTKEDSEDGRETAPSVSKNAAIVARYAVDNWIHELVKMSRLSMHDGRTQKTKNIVCGLRCLGVPEADIQDILDVPEVDESA